MMTAVSGMASVLLPAVNVRCCCADAPRSRVLMPGYGLVSA